MTTTPANKTARQLRSEERKKRMVTNRASSFAEAEAWDLAYWQSKTPQERLSALQDILDDVADVEKSREHYESQH
ncbi:MAG: hypothetical protein EOL87_03665 [Spartobacteria bacterium]|nr:hypothetical protein [Spartobacteria bacterium]